MIDGLTDLLALDEFRTGVLFGLLASVGVGLGVALARRALPLAGVAFGVATVLSLVELFTVEVAFVAGLIVLAVAGGLACRRGPVVRVVAAVPGALLFTRGTDLHDPGWAMGTILVVTLVGGVLVADFDQSFGRTGLPPVLLAVTALGIYGTTPDTEHSAILAGAALSIALLGWPRPLASLGVAGSLITTALVAWDVVLDGMSRHGAVVGGLACLGMLVVEPVVRWASQRAGGAGRRLPARDTLWVAALHLGVVVVCSRVAGLRTSATQSLVISSVAYGAAAALLVSSRRRRAAADLRA
jgi:hypothetical protein